MARERNTMRAQRRLAFINWGKQEVNKKTRLIVWKKDRV